ncbi:PEP-CTERM sorting domain-containing protein [Salinimonas iocasae]|uniref:PEP-CTERM sorting domain-containing protein n=1 Tax=Salinimonas iocasae TaxID=2572577 RepID=A0A5B7YFS1_9ALTE|nr:PEP-CTERM sorting domain-containing protein [Salinimonas iocasae]QCZ94368.1 PEP-CTERM sorting domain-containing protein [Salinimonas iocasae]
MNAAKHLIICNKSSKIGKKMKKKFWKIVSATTFICASHFANAALVTANKYTLDTDTNIVSDGTLEWLQWDVTSGLSINSSLEQYSGWSLASNSQMEALFSDFFSNNTWTSNESEYQLHSEAPFDDVPIYNTFLDLFGSRVSSSDIDNEEYSLTYLNSRQEISAFFGSDEDGDNRYNIASVKDWSYARKYIKQTQETRSVFQPANALMTKDNIRLTDSHNNYGVALVRPQQNADTVNVSEPATLMIFSLGMLGIVARRSKK